MKKPVVHYGIVKTTLMHGRYAWAACGILWPKNAKRIHKLVTCKNCKRTKVFRGVK